MGWTWTTNTAPPMRSRNDSVRRIVFNHFGLFAHFFCGRSEGTTGVPPRQQHRYAPRFHGKPHTRRSGRQVRCAWEVEICSTRGPSVRNPEPCAHHACLARSLLRMMCRVRFLSAAASALHAKRAKPRPPLPPTGSCGDLAHPCTTDRRLLPLQERPPERLKSANCGRRAAGASGGGLTGIGVASIVCAPGVRLHRCASGGFFDHIERYVRRALREGEQFHAMSRETLPSENVPRFARSNGVAPASDASFQPAHPHQLLFTPILHAAFLSSPSPSTLYTTPLPSRPHPSLHTPHTVSLLSLVHNAMDAHADVRQLGADVHPDRGGVDGGAQDLPGHRCGLR